MRHILVHVYFDIDEDTVWRVATADLPGLVDILVRALAALPEDEPKVGGQ